MLMIRTTEPAVRRLTYQDYLRFPDDGKRHELIDGVHLVTATPSVRHQQIVRNLIFRLSQYLDQHGGGQLLHAPLGVVFTLYDVVQPDLLYVSDARKQILTEAAVHGAPDLVVEVLSPSTRKRDEGTKRTLYDRSDVVEYWIVDPASDSIRVYRRVKGRLAMAEDLNRDSGDSLGSPLMPGLALPLDRVFSR